MASIVALADHSINQLRSMCVLRSVQQSARNFLAAPDYTRHSCA
jgi:hypothetical protein